MAERYRVERRGGGRRLGFLRAAKLAALLIGALLGASPGHAVEAVNVRTELGYNYIFNSNWMLQGFIRSPGENTELWQDAFKSKFNDATVPTTVSNIITGVSVGYRFDTDRYQAETH